MTSLSLFTFMHWKRNGNPLQCSCLENPRDRGAWWAAVCGLAESDMTERLHFHFSLACIGEGNGSPLQCSCLENPRDGGAWWAAVYGVSQSRIRLKRLSSSSSSSSHIAGRFLTARATREAPPAAPPHPATYVRVCIYI